LEVGDLLNLLRLLDNPLQDVPALAVLHSPLAGLTLAELAEIRLALKGGDWSALLHWHAATTEKLKTGWAPGDEAGSSDSESGPAGVRRSFEKVSLFLERF